MVVTKVVDHNGDTSIILANGNARSQVCYYVSFKRTDDAVMQAGKLYINGEEYVFEDVENTYLLFFFNWYTLSTEQRTKIGSQIWMFDEESQIWHPQTALYTG